MNGDALGTDKHRIQEHLRRVLVSISRNPKNTWTVKYNFAIFTVDTFDWDSMEMVDVVVGETTDAGRNQTRCQYPMPPTTVFAIAHMCAVAVSFAFPASISFSFLNCRIGVLIGREKWLNFIMQRAIDDGAHIVDISGFFHAAQLEPPVRADIQRGPGDVYVVDPV